MFHTIWALGHVQLALRQQSPIHWNYEVWFNLHKTTQALHTSQIDFPYGYCDIQKWNRRGMCGGVLI
jgi:hypothetical protein